MSQNMRLSDYRIIHHLEAKDIGVEAPLSLKPIVATPLLFLDRKMHFTGFRGGMWRLIIGIGRSDKNPNICNA